MLHISWTLIIWLIFIKLHTNVPHSEMVCITHDQLCKLKMFLRSLYSPLNFVFLHISWTIWLIFIKLHQTVSLSEPMTQVCRLIEVNVTHQGNGIYPSISCRLHIWSYTGPRSAVGNVSGYRCVSDCRSRGREFDPGPVPYFRGDWSWNNFYGHSPPSADLFKKGCCQLQAKVCAQITG